MIGQDLVHLVPLGRQLQHPPQYFQLAVDAGHLQLGLAFLRDESCDQTLRYGIQGERIETIQPRPIEQATIFVALGDKDRAFEALNRAIPLGPVRIGRDLYYPEFAPLHGDLSGRIMRCRSVHRASC